MSDPLQIRIEQRTSGMHLRCSRCGFVIPAGDRFTLIVDGETVRAECADRERCMLHARR